MDVKRDLGDLESEIGAEVEPDVLKCQELKKESDVVVLKSDAVTSEIEEEHREANDCIENGKAFLVGSKSENSVSNPDADSKCLDSEDNALEFERNSVGTEHDSTDSLESENMSSDCESTSSYSNTYSSDADVGSSSSWEDTNEYASSDTSRQLKRRKTIRRKGEIRLPSKILLKFLRNVKDRKQMPQQPCAPPPNPKTENGQGDQDQVGNLTGSRSSLVNSILALFYAPISFLKSQIGLDPSLAHFPEPSQIKLTEEQILEMAGDSDEDLVPESLLKYRKCRNNPNDYSDSGSESNYYGKSSI